MAKEEQEKTKNADEMYSLAEIATQTQPVILNNKTEEQYDIYAALGKILNDLDTIKKNIVG